jgi:hypothetical protein
MALPELLSRGIAVSNPELQPQVQAFQAKTQAEQQAAALVVQQQADAQAQQKAAELARQLADAEARREAKAQADAEQRQAERQAERERHQAERQAERDRRQEKYESERQLENAIAAIKQQAADEERDAAAVVAQSKSSAPKAGAVAVDVPAATRTRLAGEDVILFKGAERALAAGDMKALASHLRKIDQVENKLTSAATPNGWDTKKFDEDQEARQLAGQDFNRRREAVNAEAKARGEKAKPFAVGQGTFTSETYDYYQQEAAKAIERHMGTKRPLGLFSRETKDTKAWDARTADLEKYKATCDKAIAWRDGAEAAAKTADGATFYSRLDVIRNEHEAKAAAAIAKCAPAKGRLQDFAQERKRIERATGALGPQDQKELALERGRGHGMGR